MASVDSRQGFIVGRLQSIFNPDQVSFGIGLEQFQYLFRNAVRPRADGQADHTRNGQGLIVKGF